MNKHLHTEIKIQASREKVWLLLTHFPSHRQWNPFMISLDGELQEGKRLKIMLRNKGKDFLIRPLVKEVNPGHGFAWLGSLWFKGLFDGYHYFEIRESGPGQVTLVHGEKFSGLLSGFILQQIGKDTLENFQRMNEALKRRAENEPEQ